MSVIKFEIKKEHLILLKNLRWSINKQNIISGVADEGDEIAPPFGEYNIYDAISLMLKGKPESLDFMTYDDFFTYTDEEKSEWDKLYSELPIALEIVLTTGKFELGHYKARYHNREWVKIK
jgi:hypothetical protein